MFQKTVFRGISLKRLIGPTYLCTRQLDNVERVVVLALNPLERVAYQVRERKAF